MGRAAGGGGGSGGSGAELPRVAEGLAADEDEVADVNGEAAGLADDEDLVHPQDGVQEHEDAAGEAAIDRA